MFKIEIEFDESGVNGNHFVIKLEKVSLTLSSTYLLAFIQLSGWKLNKILQLQFWCPCALSLRSNPPFRMVLLVRGKFFKKFSLWAASATKEKKLI